MDTRGADSGACQNTTRRRVLRPRTDAGPCIDLQAWVTVYTFSAAFFVGMEWLFFGSKPSFLTALTPLNQVLVFGATLLPLVAVGAFALAVFAAIGRTSVPLVRTASHVGMRALPAILLGLSGLLLVDNFTTTLFGWGIATVGVPRLPYVAGVLVAGTAGWVQTGRWAAYVRARGKSHQVASPLAIALVVIAGAGASSGVISATPWTPPDSSSPHRPLNVMLIGIDGLSADHLSIYGYKRATTPFLDELSRNALVFTNAYSNAANTGGALTAILTGRLPTETRVIHPPDILMGADPVRHLPHLLRARGYRTGQFVVPHYAASTDFNLLGGFDVVNGRAGGSDVATTRLLLALGPGGYLLHRIVQRVQTRIEALAGHGEYSSYEQVTESRAAQYMDRIRLRQLAVFLAGDREPWLAHVHLLVTHGPRFALRRQHFSARQAQVRDWMTDFYDDAIVEADESVGEIVQLLRVQGTFDRTLIIVYSDHPQNRRTIQTVPLLVRVPGLARHGRIGQTVQTVDIAPTVLDALGIAPPGWMTGQSLLVPVRPCRPVFGAIAAGRVQLWGHGDYYTVPTPPYFSLGAVSLVLGTQWFVLSLDSSTRALSGGAIAASEGALTTCDLLTPSEARDAIIDHLRTRGYDVSH
jgi:arylsulfatase A-like enzyme